MSKGKCRDLWKEAFVYQNAWPRFFQARILTAFWYLLYHHHGPWSQTWKKLWVFYVFSGICWVMTSGFSCPPVQHIAWEMSSRVFGCFPRSGPPQSPLTFIPSSPLQVDASLPPKGASLGFVISSLYVWAFPKNPLNTTNLYILESQGAMQTPRGGLPASCGTRK